MDWINILLGAGIIWTCLCRIKRMSAASTLATVRYSVSLLAAAGLVLILSATVRPHWHDAALTFLALAMLCVQASTSRLWRDRVPESFSRPTPLDAIDSDWMTHVSGGKR
ncbi:hypothetical protein MW290_24650 [Aquincola tertiaricarbonis]|uniref:Uncharacterized protein n=1 Tax=Aquincola tertiaricarbonis TaxID=391953 RepID=A0ABY4S7Z8_AQUTE|nr:hypothetical protein [Aquincola tertiaricarbonis]URI08770.1 hypothetical protein MW290_24650 [Aquincola tertiaricarbonis]